MFSRPLICASVVYLLICVACAGPVNQPLQLKITHLQHKTDKLELSVNRDVAVLEVSSESGIGTGVVERVQGRWPDRLIVRLYLRGLEGFSVSNGTVRFEKSDLSVKVFDEYGKPLTQKYLLHENGYYEVQVPASIMVTDISSIEFQWVDFYR